MKSVEEYRAWTVISEKTKGGQVKNRYGKITWGPAEGAKLELAGISKARFSRLVEYQRNKLWVHGKLDSGLVYQGGVLNDVRN
jgi:hypothetical protein